MNNSKSFERYDNRYRWSFKLVQITLLTTINNSKSSIFMILRKCCCNNYTTINSSKLCYTFEMMSILVINI